MKITKEHVGKIIRKASWDKSSSSVKVLAVGKETVYVQECDDFFQEYIEEQEDDWIIVSDPKPQGAPAFIKDNCSPYWRVTDIVFPSEDWASEYLKSWDRVIWPALIDPKTGMYILPEEK